ncbi:Cytochrome P450 [Mycena kentingensis (nom. inval.)]|nr:Cytochrome P450 [Mycena kentingensis (nom. inval.)]
MDALNALTAFGENPPDTRAVVAVSTVGLVFAYYVNKAIKAWRANPGRLPYPPGPRPLPLVGNVPDIPQTFPWLTYTEWGRKYGPLVHLTAFGDHILVINSAKMADDLLEKRSQIYSDRPSIPMIGFMGWGFNMGFMQYGDKWRTYRRLMHQFFKKEATAYYRPIQRAKIHDMLRQVLATPADFRDHIRTEAAAIIMASVYGYDVKPVKDEFVRIAEDAVARLGVGVFSPINMAPWVRFLPGWLPGCGFQKFLSDTRAVVKKMKEVPYEWAKANMLQGIDSTSVVAKMLETGQGQAGSVDEEMCQAVAGLAYAAGADTTVSAISTLFLVLAMHPEVQKRAQADIDAVVGPNRLPDFSDRPRLPYIDAIYREILRWRPILPLSVAHGTTEDDIYEGYFIPKGTTVFANVWAMSYEESVFPEPAKFRPERYLTADGKLTDDPRMDITVFGHGRRICAGRYVAEESVWLSIASILASFDVTKKKGVDIPGTYCDGLIIHPHPFECNIVPRSADARALVEATVDAVYD